MLTITHEIRIEGLPEPVSITCAPRTPLLDAMVAAGVPVAFCCRAGLCGMCKTELSSGEVSHDTCSDRALTPEDRSAGRILTCRASPLSPCIVRPLNILGTTGASFSGTLGSLHGVHALTLPVDATLNVVAARVEAAGNLDAWQPGHWGWLESLDGSGAGGAMAACYAGADASDACVGYWVLRSSASAVAPDVLAREFGTVLFFDGPHGTPFDTAVENQPFVVVADALGMPFVGALAWRALHGGAVRAEAVLCVGGARHPARGGAAGEAGEAAASGNALSASWHAADAVEQYPALLRAILSARVAEAESSGRRMRVVARGASGFQNTLRRAIRGSGVRQWDVSVEATLDLEGVPPAP